MDFGAAWIEVGAGICGGSSGGAGGGRYRRLTITVYPHIPGTQSYGQAYGGKLSAYVCHTSSSYLYAYA